MTALQYDHSIAADIDVVVKQIWNGAPTHKRQGNLITLDIATAVTGINTEDTIEGSSTLTISLVDQNWHLLDSGFFDPDKNGKLDPIEINYPDKSRFWWRLANCDVSSEGHTITLTFIERAVALLMAHKGVKKASRATMNRAQFMKSLVDEVKKVKLDFKCKQLATEQKIAKPDVGTLAATAGPGDFKPEKAAQRKRDAAKKADKDPGIAHGSDFKIQRAKATDAQIDQINRALGEADKSDGANHRSREALVCAGIGESGFKAIRNQGNPPSRYWGVFQGSMDVFGVDDTEEMAHCFMVGGKGFQGGGAIKLAKDHPTWGPGLIAVTVEGSRSNFGSDAQAEHFYGQWKAEADKILDEYGPGGSGGGSSGGDGTTSTPYRRQFNYSRNKGEDSWETMTRLAEEVTWPMFADGDRIYFDSDLTLIQQQPVARINRNDAAVISFSYTIAQRKFATDASITLICDPDEFRAGDVFALDRFGMASAGKYKGKWLITNIQRDRADISSAFTLRQPITPTLEPAPDIGQHTSDGTSDGISGGSGPVRERIVQIAKNSLSTKTGYNYYLAGGIQTKKYLDDPTPPQYRNIRSDCSQFVHACYIQAGVPSPGLTTPEMMRKGTRTRHPQPGDLLCSSGHVELFVGGGRTIGHGTKPIDYANASYFSARGFIYLTYDFLDGGGNG